MLLQSFRARVEHLLLEMTTAEANILVQVLNAQPFKVLPSCVDDPLS